MTDNMGNNPKRFWTLLKDRSKSRCSSTIITVDGIDSTDPLKKAGAFNHYFQSVFCSKKHDILPEITKTQDPRLESIILTEEAVKKELRNLNPSKAAGPDGISTRVLKEAHEELAKPITTLFNKSLDEGIVPTDWKRANVAPIHKKGNKTDVKNSGQFPYYPSYQRYLRECIYNNIIDTLTEKITSVQHGFMKNRSTSTQLMTALCNIQKILDNKGQTDMIYFDLSKAFDTVPHDLLLHKLQTFGIHGRLLNWIKDYLTNRNQRTTCDGTNSSWLPVSSGVPQGSILGPLLFLLYINDLPTCISPETQCAIFADDTKIFRQIKTQEDSVALQEDINRIASWGDKWDLKFNSAKCICLTVNNTKNPRLTDYTMKQLKLTRQSTMNDLGTTVSEDLKWKVNIEAMIKKANSRLWLVRKTLGWDAPLKAKCTAYLSMVRSILEYNSVIWNPSDKNTIYDIEKVQRHATNFITNNPYRTEPGYLTYEERLDICNLMPLSYRRELTDIIFFCRSYNNKINFNIREHLDFCNRAIGARTRNVNQQLNLPIPKTKTTTAAHFYPTRLARIWNSLPLKIRETIKPLSSNLVIKQNLLPLFKSELINTFDSENTCTWIHFCQCTRCRNA